MTVEPWVAGSGGVQRGKNGATSRAPRAHKVGMLVRFGSYRSSHSNLRLIGRSNAMNQHPNNPASNQLRAGVAMDQLRDAVEKSGYPLQTEIGDLLRKSFSAQEEWCYVDRDSGDLRSIDIRADMSLHDEDSAQPRVRPQLTLLVECKHSQLPYVFFESTAPKGLIDHPKIHGLHKSTVKISSDDDPSTWTFTVIHALHLHDHAFQTAPLYCNSFSKAVRKGADIELSGTEAYSGLVLPLIKSLEHLANAEAPPKTAWYFDAHLSVGVGVLDAPMVVARRQPKDTNLELVPWVRILRHEYSADREFGERDRMWAIDVVHKDYVDGYLVTHLLPFARDFAAKVLAHTTELATGEAFAAGMGADSWRDIAGRLRPAQLRAVVKRTRDVGQHLLKMRRAKGKGKSSGK
jgi:hypothetical protein